VKMERDMHVTCRRADETPGMFASTACNDCNPPAALLQSANACTASNCLLHSIVPQWQLLQTHHSHRHPGNMHTVIMSCKRSPA
jgi:hypothetical protein